MLVLLLGLALFLGVHSLRVVAPGWRAATMARIGEGRWKGAYSLAALLGLALMVWGYGLARQSPVELWSPPVGMRHLAVTLMLVASILLFANGKRGNIVAAKLRHPMLIGAALFATAHLMANGTGADLALFGGLLVWSLVTLVSAFGRGEPVPPAGSWSRTGLDAAIGVAFWAAMLYGLHFWLFGVQPLPIG